MIDGRLHKKHEETKTETGPDGKPIRRIYVKWLPADGSAPGHSQVSHSSNVGQSNVIRREPITRTEHMPSGHSGLVESNVIRREPIVRSGSPVKQVQFSNSTSGGLGESNVIRREPIVRSGSPVKQTGHNVVGSNVVGHSGGITTVSGSSNIVRTGNAGVRQLEPIVRRVEGNTISGGTMSHGENITNVVRVPEGGHTNNLMSHGHNQSNFGGNDDTRLEFDQFYR